MLAHCYQLHAMITNGEPSLLSYPPRVSSKVFITLFESQTHKNDHRVLRRNELWVYGTSEVSEKLNLLWCIVLENPHIFTDGFGNDCDFTVGNKLKRRYGIETEPNIGVQCGKQNSPLFYGKTFV